LSIAINILAIFRWTQWSTDTTWGVPFSISKHLRAFNYPFLVWIRWLWASRE